MGVFGVDVSNWQSSFDFRGWEFAFIKATQGNWFKDGRFNQHLTNARNAGCLVAAYHYQETSDVESQIANIKSMVPTSVPIIIDVERGSGGVDITRRLVNRLWEEGYRVPLLYLPRWYWNEIGRPSLTSLPLLWASWYPDYVARPREQARDMVPSSAWADYGGLRVAIMQFTSTPFDQNWYPGSREDLARLLYGGSGGGGIDDMTVQELVDALMDDNHPLGEAFRKQLVHYEIPKKVPDGAPEEKTSIHIENRWIAENFRLLHERIDKLELGGVDPKAVAEAILETMDVDLVRRPQGS